MGKHHLAFFEKLSQVLKIWTSSIWFTYRELSLLPVFGEFHSNLQVVSLFHAFAEIIGSYFELYADYD